MKRTCIICVMTAGIIISGCSTEESQRSEGGKDINTDLVNYETKQERNEREGRGKDHTKFNGSSEGDGKVYTDLFTTEESQAIVKHLKQYKDITEAQVAIKEDEVVVAIMLAPGSNNSIRHQVKSDVSHMVQNKPVTVYTDSRYLDHMDNMNAGRKPSDIDEFIEEYLENFFKQSSK